MHFPDAPRSFPKSAWVGVMAAPATLEQSRRWRLEVPKSELSLTVVLLERLKRGRESDSGATTYIYCRRCVPNRLPVSSLRRGTGKVGGAPFLRWPLLPSSPTPERDL